MAIEKDLPPVQGNVEATDIELPSGIAQEPGVEITEDEEGVEINFEPGKEVDTEFSENIAEKMDDSDLSSLSSELVTEFRNDKDSRKDWETTYTQGLDLLGFKYEQRDQPFRDASGVTHPLLAESVTQFQAQAYKELMPSAGPVNVQIVGKETPEVYEQSIRVKNFMNYQIIDIMEDYTPDMDQMLFYLPLSGSTFKKVYYDEGLERAVSKFIPAEDLVVPYTATDLETCERVTHVVKMSSNEFRKKQVAGFYRDVEINPSTTNIEDQVKEKVSDIEGVKKVGGDSDEVTLYEMHTLLDLEGFGDKDEDGEETGIKVPYIVTIEESSGEVLSIYRNYSEDDPFKKKRQYFVHYKFLPGLGFYGFGLIHMIGGLSRTATSVLRQLLDAGKLANLPAGFKSRGLRVRDDAEPIQPGEFRDVDAPAGDLRASIMTLPFKEPSQTLYSLLSFVVEAGKRFASIADLPTADSNSQAPVGTTIALLEKGSRVISAIHKRLHYSLKTEFKLLAKVFSEYLPPVYPYEVVGGDRYIKQTDFDSRVDVIPVSDPNIFSISQRVTMAQTQLQLAQSAPALHNLREAYRRMYESMGVQNIDNILKKEEQPKPKDPAIENADSLEDQQNLYAFPGQNHDAHILAHLVFGSSPMIMANAMAAMKLQKHIMEHVSIKAQEQAEVQIRQMQTQGMDPQSIELAKASMIAQLEAQFTQEVKTKSTEISGGAAPDPIVELKAKELQIRQQDNLSDAQIAQQRIVLDQQKLQQKMMADAARIESQEDIAKLRTSNKNKQQ